MNLYKKGDKDVNGSTYKVDFKTMNPLTGDNEIMKQFDRLSRYKTSHEKMINEHNRLIKVREIAATIPDEYLRSVKLDGYLDVDDTRRLIISGCEAELKIIGEELVKMTKYFKENNI